MRLIKINCITFKYNSYYYTLPVSLNKICVLGDNKCLTYNRVTTISRLVYFHAMIAVINNISTYLTSITDSTLNYFPLNPHGYAYHGKAHSILTSSDASNALLIRPLFSVTSNLTR